MRTFRLFYFALVALLCAGFVSCSDDDEVVKSSQKQILEFSVNDTKAEINEQAKTITLTLPAGTDISKLKPVIKVSDKANISPASEAETDFASPVVYTVTAEDGSKQAYTVTIDVEITIVGTWQFKKGDPIRYDIEYNYSEMVNVLIKNIMEDFDFDTTISLNADGTGTLDTGDEEIVAITYTYENDVLKFVYPYEVFDGEVYSYTASYKAILSGDMLTIEMDNTKGYRTYIWTAKTLQDAGLDVESDAIILYKAIIQQDFTRKK